MNAFSSAALLAGGKARRMKFDKQLFHVREDLLFEVKSEYVYVIACDMPRISLDYINSMAKRLSLFTFDACVTEKGGWIEPFHAFYGKGALPAIECGLLAGKSPMRELSVYSTTYST